MAARGIPGWAAVSGSWTIARPPAARIARSPAVPSPPAPESITPTGTNCSTRAIERKSRSIVAGIPDRRGPRARTRSAPSSTSTSRSDGPT